jgi:fructokinase
MASGVGAMGMGEKRYSVVGLGEVLWDLLPQGKHLGGAPANFAYMSELLVHRAIVASRIGADALGEQLRARLVELKLDESFVQLDERHPTGTVAVTLDPSGQPAYEIARNAAWDFLEWTPQWQRLAAEANAICFGSLAQRYEVSRATIRAFLAASRANAARIFDLNLRQKFFSAEVLAESLRLANVAKLNDLELPMAMRCLGLDYDDEKASAERLRRTFDLELVCVTRGNRGSLLVRENEIDEHPGFAVAVKDLVGAGDAFTAALAHHLLLRSPLRRMNEAANRMGAWAASQSGATPPPDSDVIRAVR